MLDVREPNIITLKLALLKAWGADTARGEWRDDVPSLNQCAVTALVVQDYFGGDLLRCKLNDGDSHYWNRLSDSIEVDLTNDQFSYSKLYKVGEIVIRTREYALSFPDTLARYKLLKDRVTKILEEEK